MISEVSNTAAKVDSTFLFIVGLSVALLVLITALMLFFVIKYNRKRHPVSENIEGNLPLEIIWTVIPTVIVLAMFYYGWSDFAYIRNAPEGALPVQVTGRNWSWHFTYENGMQSDVLKVPRNKAVKLVLTSADVLHSFYIPAFRIKEDAVPGMKTRLWFIARDTGSYEIYCTEYCGTGHSHMRSKVVVLPEDEFESWHSGQGGEGEKETEKRLLSEKGCLGCHSVDGSTGVGPTLKGVFGRSTVVVTGGRERQIVIDEEYLRRSILQPAADVVKRYPAIMPALPVSREEMDALIAELKDLQ
ncbi:MAG: cytochrome c oxidase subunit II [Alphaproteobacteria bacterium]|uniref:Cytochrome c oxidase subunit 2 n=1 Tax=Candidatus Nitrobium versatile TaxID=2884831 RepID=A0A953J541_9BACT|nr:cytochrome c oxidase subunit II [Candidatus Nitrobium versatile]